MFTGIIKKNVMDAIDQLIDEGIVKHIVEKLQDNFRKQGIDITKQTGDLLSGAKIKYSFEDKAIEIEFKKSF